ncbi:MAG: DNA topoisomerase IB [Candidatus Dormibacteria bacterium]
MSAVAAVSQPVDDALQSARAAGLRWVDDSMPGIGRQGKPGAFTYGAPDGRRIRDTETLQRISDAAIPPAWTDVWISPLGNGHIQATGRDARRRKQYRYHPRWREVRDERKFARMLDFGAALPRIRARVDADLRRSGLSRERVLAAVVRLLDLTYLRVGNDEYAKENDSFGLTTLRNEHVQVKGSRVRLRFKGKSGVRHEVFVEDPRVARILARCQDLPGEELFEWSDDDGALHAITADEVNEYLRDIAGGDFTSKDFRTWAATVLAWTALRDAGVSDSKTAAKGQIVAAIKDVSGRLGNTPAVCRRCYVHPDVLTAYSDGSLVSVRATTSARRSRHADLSDDERAVLSFLRKRGLGNTHRARRVSRAGH